MKRHRINRHLITGTCVLLIAGGIAAALLARAQSKDFRTGPGQTGSVNAPGAGGPVLLVDSVTAHEESFQAVNRLTGQVEPFRTAVAAAEASERILSRPVHRGDRVGKGALLAVLNDDSARTTLSQEQHRLEQAVAARRQAEADYQRLVVETDSNRRQARAQLALAQADQQQAQALAAQAAAGERKTLALTRQQELHQVDESLSQARIGERLAKIELDRQAYLVKEGAAARDALERAQAAFDTAVARRKSAEQALSLAAEGARQEDRDFAGAQVSAAQSQVSASAQQVEQARAGLSAAETRDTRLKAASRQIDGLCAEEMQAQDAVREAQIALTKRRVLAPFTGRVLETLADTGDMTGMGTPLIRMAEISRVKVSFAVPELSRPQLQLQQPVTISADALPGRSFTGRITALGYQADPKTRCFPIEVTVGNRDELLLPNMVARVGLSVGSSVRRIRIPSGAVMGKGEDKCCVFVLDQGYARRREVRLGAANGNEVEVTSGLRSGERIASAPQRLSDGAAIRINTLSE
jgi:HlyD family secretion protein